tara:strand:+ start:1920 stop:2807 length:888 start_codon:yes stop_codon:yes gene_type:complete
MFDDKTPVVGEEIGDLEFYQHYNLEHTLVDNLLDNKKSAIKENNTPWTYKDTSSSFHRVGNTENKYFPCTKQHIKTCYDAMDNGSTRKIMCGHIIGEHHFTEENHIMPGLDARTDITPIFEVMHDDSTPTINFDNNTYTIQTENFGDKIDEYPVIFISRRDTYAQAKSLVFALNTDVWHNKDSHPNTRNTDIDMDFKKYNDIQAAARKFDWKKRVAIKKLKAHSNCLILFYEDLLDEEYWKKIAPSLQDIKNGKIIDMNPMPSYSKMKKAKITNAVEEYESYMTDKLYFHMDHKL